MPHVPSAHQTEGRAASCVYVYMGIVSFSSCVLHKGTDRTGGYQLDGTRGPPALEGTSLTAQSDEPPFVAMVCKCCCLSILSQTYFQPQNFSLRNEILDASIHN